MSPNRRSGLSPSAAVPLEAGPHQQRLKLPLTQTNLWSSRYNVFGGGDSHLYGVEGPGYYLLSGLLNFNAAFLLAIGLLPALLVGILRLAWSNPGQAAGQAGRAMLSILVVVSPIYTWLGALTALPHKEERFAYVVYPLICVGKELGFHESFRSPNPAVTCTGAFEP